MLKYFMQLAVGITSGIAWEYYCFQNYHYSHYYSILQKKNSFYLIATLKEFDLHYFQFFETTNFLLLTQHTFWLVKI